MPRAKTTKSRPHDVTVVSVVLFFSGSFGFLISLALGAYYSPLALILLLPVPLACFAVGIAFLMMKPWARRAAQIVLVIGLLTTGPGLILAVLGLHRLSKLEVKVAFGGKLSKKEKEELKYSRCKKCGAKLDPIDDSVPETGELVCPKCGQRTRAKKLKCEVCGKPAPMLHVVQGKRVCYDCFKKIMDK